MSIPIAIARLYGAYMVGGSDAGQKITLFYPTSRTIFPILPDSVEVEPDSAAGTFGLAWYHGINPLGQPKFQVRDDVVLNSKIAWHEAGHALEEVIASRMAVQTGMSFLDSLDSIRTRYWAFRQFTGTWWDRLALANSMTGQGAAWSYLPGESVAEAISAATGGYVESEWTYTEGEDLAIQPGTWTTNRIYDPSGGGMRSRAFWQELMQEVDMDEATVRSIADAAATEAMARAGFDPGTKAFIANRLAKDAHHKHGVLTSAGTTTDLKTTEPVTT